MTRHANAGCSAPSDRLWSVVSEVTNWPDHLETFDAVTPITDPSEGRVGQRFRVRQPGLPRATYEITEWVEGSSFTWVARSPGVVTTATHEVTSRGAGSAITLGVAWRGPLAPLVRLVVGARTQRMIDVEAGTLANVAETDG